MVLTPSTMVQLGTPCPDFALPATDGRTVHRGDYDGQPLLVAFICNHCPYVKHIQRPLAAITREIAARGIGVVAINSNDVENYPDDSPERMAEDQRRFDYAFPYLFDASQAVAQAFRAACTPDFFLYDAEHRLVYRGQFDDSRPSNGRPVTGADLLAAVAALGRGEVVAKQVPSMGCNIKWKA
jgi:peroxiredoxin